MLIADLILELTAQATGISVRQIKSDAQAHNIADARKIAIALMLEHNCNGASIARILKYKHRSGSAKAFEQHKNMMQNETKHSSYIITFRKAQISSRRSVDMLMNDSTLSLSDVLQLVARKS